MKPLPRHLGKKVVQPVPSSLRLAHGEVVETAAPPVGAAPNQVPGISECREHLGCVRRGDTCQVGGLSRGDASPHPSVVQHHRLSSGARSEPLELAGKMPTETVRKPERKRVTIGAAVDSFYDRPFVDLNLIDNALEYRQCLSDRFL